MGFSEVRERLIKVLKSNIQMTFSIEERVYSTRLYKDDYQPGNTIDFDCDGKGYCNT